jgi:hypothetical protein
MMKINFKTQVLMLASACILSACDKDNTVTPEPVKSETFRDLAADPTTTTSTGQPASTGKYTFFSFKNGLVSSADSASTKWDIAFRATSIIVNGGTSGPGQGAALIRDGIFSEILEAPSTGYVQDAKPNFAITASSGRGWYNYNPVANLITPIAGKVLIFKTADGKYAKMEILSYYKGAPATPTATDVSRYYTFRYVYQPDGSTKLQ